MDTISSAISTLEVSTAPDDKLPRPPPPGAPSTASPLSAVATHNPAPARPKPDGDANLATDTSAMATERPLLNWPNTRPSLCTLMPVKSPEELPSWDCDETLLSMLNCVIPSRPVPPSAIGVPTLREMV